MAVDISRPTLDQVYQQVENEVRGGAGPRASIGNMGFSISDWIDGEVSRRMAGNPNTNNYEAYGAMAAAGRPVPQGMAQSSGGGYYGGGSQYTQSGGSWMPTSAYSPPTGFPAGQYLTQPGNPGGYGGGAQALHATHDQAAAGGVPHTTLGGSTGLAVAPSPVNSTTNAPPVANSSAPGESQAMMAQNQAWQHAAGGLASMVNSPRTYGTMQPASRALPFVGQRDRRGLSGILMR